MGWWRRAGRILYLVCVLAALGFANVAAASEYHGLVTFGGLPVPGATITVTQGTKKLTTVSEQGGIYSFPDLADGPWKIEIQMQCFSTIHAEITVVAEDPCGKVGASVAAPGPDRETNHASARSAARARCLRACQEGSGAWHS